MRRLIGLFLTLSLLIFVWTRGGLDTFYLDTDFARDLGELSNLWIGQTIIWLGPWLSAGFNTSPIYYYIFYPALWIGQGNAYSLLIFNLLIAATALGVFGFWGHKIWGMNVLIPVLLIGLTPWWQISAMHPGNGYSFIFFLFMALTGLWFEWPIFLSALLLGISISFHPAAVFGILFLFYEWWRLGHSAENLIFIILGLALPWGPIIAFEIITRGYLIRHWLDHPSIGTQFKISGANLQQIIASSGLAFIAILVYAINRFKLPEKILAWIILSGIALIFFVSTAPVPASYLFGIICILWFIASVALVRTGWGLVLLTVFMVLFFVKSLQTKPRPTAKRPISRIETVVNRFADRKKLDSSKKIAVVSVLGKETKVPQADDYRFFLRIKGFTVFEPQQYSRADTLIMFIEEPGFEFENWSNWEIEQFGPKKLSYEMQTAGIKIVVFDKK